MMKNNFMSGCFIRDSEGNQLASWVGACSYIDQAVLRFYKMMAQEWWEYKPDNTFDEWLKNINSHVEYIGHLKLYRATYTNGDGIHFTVSAYNIRKRSEEDER